MNRPVKRLTRLSSLPSYKFGSITSNKVLGNILGGTTRDRWSKNDAWKPGTIHRENLSKVRGKYYINNVEVTKDNFDAAADRHRSRMGDRHINEQDYDDYDWGKHNKIESQIDNLDRQFNTQAIKNLGITKKDLQDKNMFNMFVRDPSEKRKESEDWWERHNREANEYQKKNRI